MHRLNQHEIAIVSGATLLATFIRGCVTGSVGYIVNYADSDGFKADDFAMATIGTGVTATFSTYSDVGNTINDMAVQPWRLPSGIIL
jgi:hypothetical protein